MSSLDRKVHTAMIPAAARRTWLLAQCFVTLSPPALTANAMTLFCHPTPRPGCFVTPLPSRVDSTPGLLSGVGELLKGSGQRCVEGLGSQYAYGCSRRCRASWGSGAPSVRACPAQCGGSLPSYTTNCFVPCQMRINVFKL